MKITGLEIFHVKPRWLFLKLTTDDGLVGWGEPGVDGGGRTVAAALTELQPLLIGQDPNRIEYLWQLLVRSTQHRGGPIWMGAISGIEHALWDLKGKALNAPVFELLGGASRARVRMCGPCGGSTPQDAAFQAKGLRVKGYTVIKASLDPAPRGIESADYFDKTLARLTAIREEVGRGVELAVDFHGRVRAATARRLIPMLESLNPLFIEAPCPPEDLEGMAAIAASTPIPIASGGRYYGRASFRDLLQKRAVAILQPGISFAGGILETRKIASLAETFGATVAPHHALGPIALAAALHADACTPNLLAQEHPAMTNRWDVGQGCLTTPFELREGFLELPKGPGLGVTPNEDALRERAGNIDWDQPRPATPDEYAAVGI